jgi:16S rRNA processing protein RimM
MTGEIVLLGRIVGVHGLKGEVKIAAFTGEPEDIASYGALRNADGTRQFHIAGLRSAKGATVIARLRGVAGRDEAEALRGTGLYVLRAALPQPESEEYYHSDLIGLEAVSPDGEPLGEVIAVHNFGAGDLLEIRFTGERQAALIPFESAHVPQVDIAGRRVTVVRPVYEKDESEREP